MIEVVPAIIPKSFEDLREHLARVKSIVTRVQIDIIDGVFVPSKSWPYNGSDKMFEKLLDEESGLPFWKELDFEIDMMVKEPERIADDWVRVGADTFIVHMGSTDALDAIIEEVHERDVKVGLAVRPSILDKDFYTLVPRFDFIQLMGNDKVGYHGVTLDERVYAQARRLRERFPNATMAVDIGVNRESAPKLVQAGVNKLVSGSSIFESNDIRGTVDYFRSL